MKKSGHSQPDGHGGSDTVISCRGVGYEYISSGWCLSDVNVELSAGDVLALTGPNGSGKTTLIKLLATISRPKSGTLRLFDLNSDRHAMKIRQKIGYVAQRSTLADGLTAYDNLILAAAFHGFSPYRARDRVWELLDIFALTDLEERKVGELSGGQYRRVALARAMVGDPKLLLLDEPTVGMDASSRSGFHRFLQVLSAEADVSIVIASHDAMEVARLADTCLALDNGRVVSVEPGVKRTQDAGSQKDVDQHVKVQFLREVPPEAMDYFGRLVPSVRLIDSHTLELGMTSEEPLNEMLKILAAAAPILSVDTLAADGAEISSKGGG